MKEIGDCGALLLLALLSGEDIRERQISAGKVAAGIVAALGYRILTGSLESFGILGSRSGSGNLMQPLSPPPPFQRISAFPGYLPRTAGEAQGFAWTGAWKDMRPS